jgi:hypothetical protein
MLHAWVQRFDVTGARGNILRSERDHSTIVALVHGKNNKILGRCTVTTLLHASSPAGSAVQALCDRLFRYKIWTPNVQLNWDRGSNKIVTCLSPTKLVNFSDLKKNTVFRSQYSYRFVCTCINKSTTILRSEEHYKQIYNYTQIWRPRFSWDHRVVCVQ